MRDRLQAYEGQWAIRDWERTGLGPAWPRLPVPMRPLPAPLEPVGADPRPGRPATRAHVPAAYLDVDEATARQAERAGLRRGMPRGPEEPYSAWWLRVTEET